jgi:hypothetical protein
MNGSTGHLGLPGENSLGVWRGHWAGSSDSWERRVGLGAKGLSSISSLCGRGGLENVRMGLGVLGNFTAEVLDEALGLGISGCPDNKNPTPNRGTLCSFFNANDGWHAY